jgi:hypothetical protein
VPAGVAAQVAILLCCALIVAAVWSASASASASLVRPYLSSFGGFSNVQGVAIDQSSGDVYIYDSGAGAIFKYEADGSPGEFTATKTDEITGLGGTAYLGNSEAELAVDNSSGVDSGDIYLAQGGETVTIFNRAGEQTGALTGGAGAPWGEACGVAVDTAGNVYVGIYTGDIDKYDLHGTVVSNSDYAESIGVSTTPCNVAVDSAGDVFAAIFEAGPIERWTSSQFGMSSAAGSVVDSVGSSLTVDPANDDILVNEYRQVAQFGPHGEPFETPEATFGYAGEGAISGSYGIAVNASTDDVYVPDGKGKISVFGPPVSLLETVTGGASELSTTGATLSGSVNPESTPVTECFFEYGEASSYGKTVPCAETPAQLGSGSQPIAVRADMAGLEVGPIYHFRLVAASADGTADGQDRSFSLSAPAVEGVYATSVTGTSTTLQGAVNPNANETTYYFEYGTGSDYGSRTAASDTGEADVSQPALAHLQGLTPGTTYDYRLVASSIAGTTYGVNLTFTTQSAGGPLTLLDARQWQLVSPPMKEGAGILAQRREGDVIQASESGDAISYIASNPIEPKPEGNSAPEASQIMARRTADGRWVNRTLDTANEYTHQLPIGVGLEYEAFSEDLRQAIVQPSGNTPLAPSATSERTPYLRNETACGEGATTCFAPFLTREDTMHGAAWDPNPPDSVPGLQSDIHFQDATPDVSHSVIFSEAQLLEGAAKEGLYEWSLGGQLQFVSINAAGEPVDGEFAGPRNGISGDGSRIVWCEERCGGNTPLLMRDTATGETLTIASGAGTTLGATFQAATEDVSRIFYTVAPTYNEKQLWECEVVEVAGKLTCDSTEIAPLTLGLTIGIGNAGTTVYFVSTAALAGTAEAGADNLYVAHLDGGKWGPRFIAMLASEDLHDWGELGGTGEGLWTMTAAVAPNGRFLSFMSNRSLTGYDNHDAVSGRSDQEVFLYDDLTGKLVCASCNRTGARPDGVYMQYIDGTLVNSQSVWRENWVAATVPGWQNSGLDDARRQTRYLSNEGRLFFNSSDSLVPQDTNGQQDAYEYEPEGTGNCARAEGCVGLVSGGKSGRESVFLEASASGDDVFFITAAELTSQDIDTAYDVYDAHVCTSALPCVQQPVSPPPCNNGEACKPALTPQPAIFGAPASATFTGAGNPAQPASAPTAKPKAKPLTRAQKLAKALKACRKDKSKSKRSSCEKQARKKYGAKPKAKAKSHKAKAHKGGK